MPEIIYNFMCDIKDEIEDAMPDADVTVSAYTREVVLIRARWRIGGNIYELARKVTVTEITSTQSNLVAYLCNKFQEDRAKQPASPIGAP